MRMPFIDGHRVHQTLIERHSTLSVIIMTALGDIPMAVAEIKLGAVDFLSKPLSFERIKKLLS